MHAGELAARLPEALDLPVSRWSMLSSRERELTTRVWNSTDRAFPDGMMIHQWFEASVARTPDAIAVIDHDGAVSYAELDLASSRIANALLDEGIERGDLVAVHAARNRDLPAALLGVLRAGGAYVPLDDHWPAKRVSSVLSSLRVRLAVASDTKLPALSDANEAGAGLRVVCTCRESDRAIDISPVPGALVRGPSHARAPVNAAGRDAPRCAYVIFTSGSTGVPKGVSVAHSAVANLINWVNRTHTVNESDRLLFVTSPGFDLSVYDLFGIFGAGGSVRIASEAEMLDPERLAAILRDESISFWDSAPALLDQVLMSSPACERWPALRLAFLSGDWIGLDLPAALAARGSQVRFVALGGATEATVWSNSFEVEEVSSAWASIPYGKPIQNARYYVLDERQEPMPLGVAGELFIGGQCVAIGYAGDPSQTAERFLPDPFRPGERVYRTGDLARWNPDGNLELLGRIDRQVKVRGYRVEPGEIESALVSLSGVSSAVVLSEPDPSGDRRLVGFVRCNGDRPNAAALRAAIDGLLPSYMVPSELFVVDAFPLTGNGKIDRADLLRLAEERRTRSTAMVEAGGTTTKTQHIAGLLGSVLGRALGPEDDFFDAGGDSLSAMRAAHALRARGIPIAVADVYEHRSAAMIARSTNLEQAERSSGASPGPVPLAPTQRWILGRGIREPSRYNDAFLIDLGRSAGHQDVLNALRTLCARHDALRTRFACEAEGWTQRLLRSAEPGFRSIECDGLTIERTNLIVRETAHELRCTLDLASGPLANAALIYRGRKQTSLLLLVMHHLVFDGYSAELVLADLEHLLRTGTEPDSPPGSFAEWARWADARRPTAVAAGAIPQTPSELLGVSNTYGDSRSITSVLPLSSRISDRELEANVVSATARVLGDWAGVEQLGVAYTGVGRSRSGPGTRDSSTVVGCLSTVVPMGLLAGSGNDDADSERRNRDTLEKAREHGADLGWGALIPGLKECWVKFNHHGTVLRDAPLRLVNTSLPGVIAPSERRAFLFNVDTTVDHERNLRVTLKYPSELCLASEVSDLVSAIAKSGAER
ncbi:MAG: amino acid adenylation domain-containing protein [Planctomycetota bacterium]